MTVGRVPTVGDASHTLHCRERGVEAVTAGGTSMSSWIAVGGSGKLANACWTSSPALKSVPRYLSGGMEGGVSTRGPGGSGPPHVARSSGRGWPAVDAGKKYAGECSVDSCTTSGRSSDEGVTSFSPPVVFVG